MSKDIQDFPQVSRLSIKPREYPPDGDWRATTGSNNKGYVYRFLGGSKGRGHLSVPVDYKKTHYLVRVTTPGYTIESVSFDSHDGQLDLEPRQACTNEATITNKNDRVMQGYYHVIVRSPKGVLIDCDPMISNDPKNR